MQRQMNRRVVSLWLPTFPTDLLEKKRRKAAAGGGQSDAPLVTFATVNGALRVAAANGPAQEAGLKAGVPLTDAGARVPGLLTFAADPAGDAGALDRLADWCRHYTPWTAVARNGQLGDGRPGDGRLGDGSWDGLWLDISGCAHLLGGEQALLQDLTARLKSLGLRAFAAVADTPGGAWAVARFGTKRAVARFGTKRAVARFGTKRAVARFDAGDCFTIVPPGESRAALAPLPVAGLRLDAAVVEGLSRVGLRRIGDLLDLPRGPLAARFGKTVITRLDQALGVGGESLSPRQPVPPLYARLAFAEPMGRSEDIAVAARHLLSDLCPRLELARLGVRRLELALYRVDASRDAVTIGTSRPVRDADHLEGLLAEKLDKLRAGFGVEVMVLAATAVDPLPPYQPPLSGPRSGDGDKREPHLESLARLVDRLGNRLGSRQVIRLAPHASHIPERACREVPALTSREVPVLTCREVPALSSPVPGPQSRPLRLLPWPEPIEAVAPLPDHAPVMFRWRRHQHRMAKAEGPERIGAEWWLNGPADVFSNQPPVRDYYRVEDTEGRRFWLYREGLYRPGVRICWFLHGMFP